MQFQIWSPLSSKTWTDDPILQSLSTAARPLTTIFSLRPPSFCSSNFSSLDGAGFGTAGPRGGARRFLTGSSSDSEESEDSSSSLLSSFFFLFDGARFGGARFGGTLFFRGASSSEELSCCTFFTGFFLFVGFTSSSDSSEDSDDCSAGLSGTSSTYFFRLEVLHV